MIVRDNAVLEKSLFELKMKKALTGLPMASPSTSGEPD